MRNSTAVAVLAGLTLACTAAPLPDQAPTSVSPLVVGQGQVRVVDQVVVIDDASGTTYARKTFPEGKAITRSFVNVMPEANSPSQSGQPYEAGLIGFGGEDRMTSPLAPFNRSALASTAAGLQVMGDVDGRGGETPYRHVFEEVTESLAGKPGRAAVVMVSDGLPDFPDLAAVSAKLLSDSRGGNICFHAVRIGNDEQGLVNLQTIAAQFSCGSVRDASQVRDPAGLTAFARDVFLAAAAPAPPPMAADECKETLRLRGVNFAFDKAEITPDSAVVLDVAVDRLRQCGNIHMRIDGYTDSTGPDDYNMGLSQRRANAVKNYFVSKGITSSRLTTQGFGETNPIASNATREGRAQNRRVELIPSP